MSLREEIQPYKDSQGLVAPNIPDNPQGSDNGTLFTSEYYIMLSKRGELRAGDRADWVQLIEKCMFKPGLTLRYPGDISVDAPDNLYGILAAAEVLNIPGIAEDIYIHGLAHCGFYNPTSRFTWAAFQWRQPQLLFAMICASGHASRWKLWQWPLSIYTALVIAVSCVGVPKESTDPRRLAWLLIQTVQKHSWICWLTSKLWRVRLWRDYSNEMCDVAGIYYKPLGAHPFAKYWIT